MTLTEFETLFSQLPEGYKTKDVDRLNRQLIRQGASVAWLRELVPEHPEYFRSYFQVSLGQIPEITGKMAFLEENFHLLQDWWHVDCLPVFLGNALPFDYALEKAREYVESELPYVRRFGYVLFIPRLVRDPANIPRLLPLLKNDGHYHVVMAQAWLISYLAMCDWEQTWQYLNCCPLDYAIAGRAIQKICDSYAVPQAVKERFKALRPRWRNAAGAEVSAQRSKPCPI